MKIIEIVSRWQKPGSKWVEVRKDVWEKQKTGIQDMAMCRVRTDGGQIVTRHLPMSLKNTESIQ